MPEYRVYRSGEDEPVRVAGGSADRVSPPLQRSPRSAGRGDSPGGSRSWLVLGLISAAVIVAGVLFWVYGRDMIGNSQAAFDLARLSGKVPDWAMVAVPVLAVVVLAAVTGYLAFGRYLAVKIVGVAVVVIALAAPGLALGWANGTVSTVGGTTAAQKAIVTKTRKQLRPELPGKAMNVLLIGSDKSGPADPGRSDTQILVRLDPATKSISMLSIPRDLKIYVDGLGYTKMNAAYSYGGPAATVKAFSTLTGLPINHYIEVNFAGFWHVVDILGGIYIPVDHRYYNPPGSGWKSIDIQPGYQLVHGKQALNFVRFRHDQAGDFTRMQRQQLFLKEMQRQSGRWSQDWTKVLKLIKAVTSQTTSDMTSLKRLKSLVELVFQVNTSKINTVHLEGSTPMIGGISYVVASQAEIEQAVNAFTHPAAAPLKISNLKLTKKMYPIRIYNGSGIAGLATTTANQLSALGYTTVVGADATEFSGKTTTIYAPQSLSAPAQLLGEMLYPSDVQIVDRAPGVADGITVVLASTFDGKVNVPAQQAGATTTLVKGRYSASAWRAGVNVTSLPLEMPTKWSSGSTYDQFRHYKIKTTSGKNAAALVAVAVTPQGGYWDIQEMRWLNPPAIQNPSSTQVIGGTEYMFFYQGSALHMVAWKRNKTLYWVINTLDNQLSNDTMTGIATSFQSVR
jgi:LCP family protein required for cell wall assembly